MKKHIRLFATILALLCLFSSCSNKQENINEAEKEDKVVNKYINSDPGRYQLRYDVWPIALIECFNYDEYRQAVAEELEFVAGKWLSWEQFSALGVFHDATWRKCNPYSCDYTYIYTDPKDSSNKIRYNITTQKIPDNSGVTNIREYFLWYDGREADYILLNTPTIASKEFKKGDLTNVDPHSSIFDNCKTKDGSIVYYVDDIIKFKYDANTKKVSTMWFVYDGWKIQLTTEPAYYGRLEAGFNESSCHITRRLINADTYMAAIKELMNPQNGGYAN